MKKLLLFTFIFLCLFSLLQAQSWSQLGAGVNGNARSSCISNGLLYVGGTFTTAGGNSATNIASWDGANWNALGTGVNNTVYCMCEYHGQLIVAGAFTNAGGLSVRKIARWNGSTWDSLGRGINGLAVYDMKVYHNKLYVTGKFGQAGTTIVKNIAVWNDTDWADVGGGLSSVWTSSEGNTMRVYQNELYVGGKFDVAGTDSMIMDLAKWNGTTWTGVGEGLYYTDHVYAMDMLNGTLWIGGDISSTSSSSVFANNLIGWNGNSFISTGPGLNGIVQSLYHYGSLLYVGGAFNLSGTTIMNKIATYDGNAFAPLSTGCNNTVYSIVADEAIVYAVGNFTTAGSASTSHVAKWSVAGMGIEENAIGTLDLFPNPSNGVFSITVNTISPDEMLFIYNSLGEKVSAVKIDHAMTSIDLSGEAGGVYFYTLSSEGEILKRGEIIIR